MNIGHHDQMMRLLARALQGGARRVSMIRWVWDISGNCLSGYSRLLFSRPAPKEIIGWGVTKFTPVGSPDENMEPLAEMRFGRWSDGFVTIGPGTAQSYELELITRCRKCDKCRAARASLWRLRAMREIGQSARTWFGTMTMTASNQNHFLSVARHRLARQGVDFDTLGFDEQFRERVRAASPDITKFLKRVRKQSSASIRYLWVAEYHQSGAPHFHALIHEVSEVHPVRHKVLTDQWKLGFTQFKLIDNNLPASYICKYLSKNACARVRASLHYGS